MDSCPSPMDSCDNTHWSVASRMMHGPVPAAVPSLQDSNKQQDKQEEYIEALKKGGVVSCCDSVQLSAEL